MFGWYALTLVDYVVVGTAIIASMFGLNWLLRRLGVNRETATGYALILPWIIGFLVWNLGPFIASLYLSFTDYTILSSPQWIGFDNYVEMFTDDRNFSRSRKPTARSLRSTTSASASHPGVSSASSAPTAPAKPPPCG
jgi:multiple sugar transport system permease protein